MSMLFPFLWLVQHNKINVNPIISCNKDGDSEAKSEVASSHKINNHTCFSYMSLAFVLSLWSSDVLRIQQ